MSRHKIIRLVQKFSRTEIQKQKEKILPPPLSINSAVSLTEYVSALSIFSKKIHKNNDTSILLSQINFKPSQNKDFMHFLVLVINQ